MYNGKDQYLVGKGQKIWIDYSKIINRNNMITFKMSINATIENHFGKFYTLYSSFYHLPLAVYFYASLKTLP